MSTMLTVRVPDDTRDMVDLAAGARGMTRSQWLAAVIDRALVGDGHLSTQQAAQRREDKADRTARYTPPQHRMTSAR